MDSPIVLRILSGVGLLCMFGLAWLLSVERSAVRWRLVAWAIALQVGFGVLVLHTPFGGPFFSAVRAGFGVITDSSNAGAQFVFGNLSQFFIIPEVMVPGAEGLEPSPMFPIGANLAFSVLPVIIFVAALSALLQHLGIVQWVVRGMAWLMRRTLKTSGAETVGAALLVFLGIESVCALGLYLKNMTRSELFVLMTGFLATIAASVMVIYAGYGAEPGHLLAASLMSAPAAIAMAKLMLPETGTPETAGDAEVELEVESHNIFDALCRGATQGLTMALQVGAMLMVFVGLIHLVNLGVTRMTGLELTEILGWVMRPFAFLMGIPRADIAGAAELLAVKSVFNEFLAYESLSGAGLSERGRTIMTYALCGFANPGSLGIMIGALAGMMPERRAEVAGLSLRAFAAGTLACFSTACVAGLLA